MTSPVRALIARPVLRASTCHSRVIPSREDGEESPGNDDARTCEGDPSLSAQLGMTPFASSVSSWARSAMEPLKTARNAVLFSIVSATAIATSALISQVKTFAHTTISPVKPFALFVTGSAHRERLCRCLAARRYSSVMHVFESSLPCKRPMFISMLPSSHSAITRNLSLDG